METVANEKIKYLNLGTLRKYACGKVSGSSEWYLKCLDCPSIDDCQVGTRAKSLLEAKTSKPVVESIGRYRKEAEDILNGCKTPVDILKSYVDKRGVYPNMSVLYRWRKTWPDLAEKYPIHEAQLIVATAVRRGEKLIFPNEPKPAEEKEESDEISVDDFLKEAKEIDDIRDKAVESVASINARPTTGLAYVKEVIQIKYQDLVDKRGKFLMQISSINEEIQRLDRLIESVELTAETLGIPVDP